MTKERWEFFFLWYEISDCGKVRNSHTGRILKAHSHHGYERVKIRDRTFAVARLVALFFVSNPNCKPFVDHINRVRNDNRFVNLRWCTHSENALNSPGMEALESKRVATVHKVIEAVKSGEGVEGVYFLIFGRKMWL